MGDEFKDSWISQMSKHLPYYEFSGNHKEFSRFLGSTFRNKIQEAIGKRKNNIINYSSYLPKSKQCFEITKQYLPQLIEETEAIANAVGVETLDYFFMNNREVYDTAEEYDKKNTANNDHCTVVAGFKGNQLTIGHNEDWAKEAID